MKNFILFVFATLTIVAGGYLTLATQPVQAQAQGTIGLTFASSLSGCQAVGQNTLCMYGSSTNPAAAVSIGGGAFVALNAAPPATAGVTSFNTRSGAVLPASGDYNFSQLAGALAATQMPANQKCNITFTLSAPTTGTSTNQLSGTAQLGGCQ